MTLARWIRDVAGDEPDATLVRYEGRYRIVTPCRQEDYTYAEIRHASFGASTRPDEIQTHMAAQQWESDRQGPCHWHPDTLASAGKNSDECGMETAAPEEQCGEPY